MTTQWWAEITYPALESEPDDDTLSRIVQAVPGYAMLTTAPTALRIETTLDADTLDAANASVLAAADAAAEAGGLGPAVGLRIVTADARDAEIAHPGPVNLVGVTEIADILGVTRQRASAITELPDFPAPVGTARGGRYWTVESVEKFDQRWQRTPGRPHKQ